MEGMSPNTLTMLGGSWIRSDGTFAQVLGKVPMNFLAFTQNLESNIDVLNTDGSDRYTV